MKRAGSLYFNRQGLVSGPGDVVEFTQKSECFFASLAAAVETFFAADATAATVGAGLAGAGAGLTGVGLSGALATGAGLAGAEAGLADILAPAVETVTSTGIAGGAGVAATGAGLAGAGAGLAEAGGGGVETVNVPGTYTGGTDLGGVAGGLGAAGGISGALAGGAAAATPGHLAISPASPASATGVPPSSQVTGAGKGVAPPGGGPAGGAVSTAAPSSVSTATGGATPAEGLGDTSGSSIGNAITPGTGAAGTGIDSLGSGVANLAPQITAPTVDTAGLSAPATIPSGGIGGAIRSAASGTNSFLKDYGNIIGAGVGIAGLGLDAIKGNQPLPGQAQLTANANSLNASSKALQNYFVTGTLPPGVQSSLDQATASAKASIRSQYASIGNTGSSAEAQDISAVDSRAVAQGSQIALSLLQQGVSEQGMADQLYQELMGNALTQDQQLGSAISSFASSLVPTVAATAKAA